MKTQKTKETTKLKAVKKEELTENINEQVIVKDEQVSN